MLGLLTKNTQNKICFKGNHQTNGLELRRRAFDVELGELGSGCKRGQFCTQKCVEEGHFKKLLVTIRTTSGRSMSFRNSNLGTITSSPAPSVLITSFSDLQLHISICFKCVRLPTIEDFIIYCNFWHPSTVKLVNLSNGGISSCHILATLIDVNFISTKFGNRICKQVFLC